MNNENEKEPLQQSARFRLFVSGLILEALVVLAPSLGMEISEEISKTIAIAIVGLVGIMIHSRTQRNKAG